MHRNRSPQLSWLATVTLCTAVSLAVPTAGAAPDQHTGAIPASDATARIDAIFQQWNSHATPGCAIGVDQNGAPNVRRAYGSADLEHDAANTPETVFEAGSVSKQFAAAAILLLAERHQLSLSDDVRKYLPELPQYEAVITLDQLLSHTSGLRDWGVIAAIAGWPRTTRAYTMDDVLTITSAQRALNYTPTTEYSYTNTGFSLLTLIVQRVTGQTMAQFAREQIFVPLGMTRTQWRDNFRRVVQQRAVAYNSTTDGYQQLMPFEDTYGHGGLLTTVGDLLRWNQALTNQRLGAFVTDKLQQRAVLRNGRQIAYARGLMVDSYHGLPQVSHAGATAGYRAWLGRFPQQHLSIALLCNAAEADSVELAHQVADLFLPANAAPATRTVKLRPRQLEALTGLFFDELSGMPLILENRQGQLAMKGERVLDAISATEFRMGGALVRFDGTDRFDLSREYAEPVRFRRTAPYTPASTDLRQQAGTYTSEEADATYLVTVQDGKLTMKLRNRPAVTMELSPAYQHAYTGDNDLLIRFHYDAAGNVTELSLGTSRVRDLRFRRVDIQDDKPR